MSSSGAGTGPPGPAGATGAAGAAGTGYSLAEKQITAAQLLTADVTPVELVAAPGANKVLIPTVLVLNFVFGTSYYNLATLPYISWGPNGALDVITGMNPDSLATNPFASQVLWVRIPNTAQSGYNYSDVANLNLSFALISACARTAPISTATIAAPGLAYVANDTGTITSVGTPSGTEATYKVLTVGALGVVTSFTVVTAGDPLYDTSHNARPTATGGAQPGIGTGFTVNVTAIPAANGSLYTDLYYVSQTLH